MRTPKILTSRDHDRGQVLVIAAVAFTVMLAFLALLFDGANGMVTRRQMQDAGDAAAVAAANVVQVGNQRGCSAGGSGNPRPSVAQAARDSLAANLTWFDASTAAISCPPSYDNQAVGVQLSTTATRFFGGIIGGDLNVTTNSVAVNGQVTYTVYSIVELNPGNPTWPNGRRGCPSVLLSGGPTVTLEGSLQVNSTCPAASGGALATNGNAARLSLTNGAKIRLVGGYSPAALDISPAPVTGVDPVPDPLATLPDVPAAGTPGMPVRSETRVTLSNVTEVLYPGVYRGGIELRNSSAALLQPGIYVMEGGGFEVGAQATVLSVRGGVTSLNVANWASDCPVGSCGVMVYNTSGSSGPMGASDDIAIGAGATLKLRAYDPDAQADGISEYEDLLIWQDRDPIATSSYQQPDVSLQGGGSVDIRGTVYAPSAKVKMSGNSGGSGGEAVNLTLQFISWDLEFAGNSAFHFYFRDQEFAKPTDYGLVE